MSAAIINGKYYPEGVKRPPVQTNNMHKVWNQDEQRRVHAADILQAHVNGKPSGAFIRQYPEESSKMFTPEQIKEYGNEY